MSDNSELFKCGVHFALFSLVSMCAGYNLKSYLEQRDRRHLLNVVVYTPLLFLEANHIAYHLKAKS